MAEVAEVEVQRAQYFKVPKTGTERAGGYKKIRDEGTGAKKYTDKISPELVDNRVERAFKDLALLDRTVSEILTRHGIFKNARIPYLNYARELYSFGRKYRTIPPDYVAALRREKAFAGATSIDVLREIEDAVMLILGIGPAIPAAAAGGGGAISL
jgi:hypothetical protein